MSLELMENKRFGIKEKDKEMSDEEGLSRMKSRTQMNPLALENKRDFSFSELEKWEL